MRSSASSFKLRYQVASQRSRRLVSSDTSSIARLVTVFLAVRRRSVVRDASAEKARLAFVRGSSSLSLCRVCGKRVAVPAPEGHVARRLLDHAGRRHLIGNKYDTIQQTRSKCNFSAQKWRVNGSRMLSALWGTPGGSDRAREGLGWPGRASEGLHRVCGEQEVLGVQGISEA